MRKTLWPLFFGTSLILASFTIVACGDDDTNPATPGSSSGTSGTSGGTSGNTSGGTSGNTSGGVDGGDAGCTFPGFVIGLINTQTRNDNNPSTDLGEACKDTQDQADFASLFQ